MTEDETAYKLDVESQYDKFKNAVETQLSNPVKSFTAPKAQKMFEDLIVTLESKHIDNPEVTINAINELTFDWGEGAFHLLTLPFIKGEPLNSKPFHNLFFNDYIFESDKREIFTKFSTAFKYQDIYKQVYTEQNYDTIDNDTFLIDKIRQGRNDADHAAFVKEKETIKEAGIREEYETLKKLHEAYFYKNPGEKAENAGGKRRIRKLKSVKKYHKSKGLKGKTRRRRRNTRKDKIKKRK
tara:strand:- start:137 stop:856 length:720 start_codon:yes stop_codon:yes gene_type:complete